MYFEEINSASEDSKSITKRYYSSSNKLISSLSQFCRRHCGMKSFMKRISHIVNHIFDKRTFWSELEKIFQGNSKIMLRNNIFFYYFYLKVLSISSRCFLVNYINQMHVLYLKSRISQHIGAR